jgi:hypothetical protein
VAQLLISLGHGLFCLGHHLMRVITQRKGRRLTLQISLVGLVAS